MATRAQKYSAREEQFLASQIAAGARPSQIATALQRSEKAVYWKGKAMGLCWTQVNGHVPTHWDEEGKLDRLKLLWAQGLSASEIGDDLGGVSRSAVLGKLNRLGLLSTERPHREKRAKASPRREQNGKVIRLRLPSSPIFEWVTSPFELHSYPCSILELQSHACHWPIGDPKKPGFHYCGAYTGGRVYCTCHNTIAYQTGGTQTRTEQRPSPQPGGGFRLQNRTILNG